MWLRVDGSWYPVKQQIKIFRVLILVPENRVWSQIKRLHFNDFLSKQGDFELDMINANLYYTSDSLWKIWLVESIQSIHNSLWTWHDKCNIYCRYCIYHVKFNVCLVTKPLGVFSETKWLNVSLQQNNYWIRFSHDIMNYQNLVSVLSAKAEGFGR